MTPARSHRSGAARRSRGPSSRWRRRLLGLVVVGLMTTLLVFVMRGRTPAPDGPGSVAGFGEAAVLDSLQRADARRDWEAALLWAERLGRLRPRDPAVLLARARAWSNYAVDQRPRRAHVQPALRTSLDRMASMQRAVALMDSAARIAGRGPQWLDAGEHLGELYETVALPGDALIVYETIKQRMPDEYAPAMRAYWLRALFYDPVHPDTMEYHREMKSLGLR